MSAKGASGEIGGKRSFAKFLTSSPTISDAISRRETVKQFFKRMALLAVLCVSSLGFAQSAGLGVGNNETFVKEISTDTLDIHLEIPVRQKSGLIPINIKMSYDSNFYSPGGLPAYWGYTNGIWRSSNFGNVVGSGVSCTYLGNIYSATIISGIYDADGNVHGISPTYYIGTNAPCFLLSSSFTAVVYDGSGYTLTYGVPGDYGSGFTIIRPDGSQISGTVYQGSTAHNFITDTNGNTAGFTYNSSTGQTTLTDSLGVAALTESTNATGCTTFNYPTSTGSANITVNCQAFTIKTNFGCTNISEANYTNQNLPVSITLPDTSQYLFTYESQVAGSVTGRLASVTYPDGHTVSYQYTGANNGFSCTDFGANGLVRTSTSAEGTYTFTRPSSTVTQVVGPAPANNKTSYTFVNGFYNNVVPTRFLTQIVTNQGSSTVLETKTFCYNGNTANCATTAPAPGLPLTQRDVFSLLSGMSNLGQVTQKFDNYGNVTETDSYDYGNAGVRPNVYAASFSYGSTWNGSSCVSIGNNVKNVPCQTETVFVRYVNGTTTYIPIANTYFFYDGNGNLLSTQKWASRNGGPIGGGPYLTTSYAHDANGLVKKITDPNNNVTTFTNTNCAGAAVGGVSVSGLLTSSVVYDDGCGGAVIVSGVNFYGSSMSAVYNDPFWRMTSSTNSAGTLTTSYSPTTTEMSQTYNGGASILDIYEKTDPLTLSNYTQTEKGPGLNWDTKQTNIVFDATGLKTTTFIPCSVAKGGGSGCTVGPTTTTHDALGRVLVQTDGGGGTVTYTYTGRDVLKVIGPAPAGEVVKQTRTEYDGLGRVQSVCELTSATGSVACGQDSGGTGFLTSYDYSQRLIVSIGRSASGAGQNKTFYYDTAGRLTWTNTPEVLNQGGVQMFYDTAPVLVGGCSSVSFTFNGQLVETMDANGNSACYTYDGANRVTSITYAGPNADGNNKYFVYDSAVVNGVTLTTPARLAEAYTAPTVGGTKVTDEGFSYTALGAISDVYQKSPHSGGYYHTSATYFENGALNTLSGVPGQSAWTFSIDGKGRPYSAVQGASSSLVNSVTYNPSDKPLVVNLGLGDTDTYTYSGTTGRMASYLFSLGSTPVTTKGVLTWNANGTLRQLAITDGINAGGTQTCKYGTSHPPLPDTMN
jgi:YD repeat-containing protein